MTKEVKLIDLKPFCGDEDVRRELSAPMLIGDRVYATNGHLAVRCAPTLTRGYLETPGNAIIASNLMEIFEKSLNRLLGVVGVEWISLDRIGDLGDMVACPECEGTKKREECPECDDRGEVTLENEYHTYECECKSCYGGSVKGVCDACAGSGRVPARPYYDIGQQRFKTDLLVLLKTLPGCEIAVDVTHSPGDAVPVRFVGGEGVLMPMRKAE